MSSIAKSLFVALVVGTALSSAMGQPGEGVTTKPQEPSQNKSNTIEEGAEPEPRVWIHLVGGGKVEVDELTESSDGVWYKRGNISTFLDRARVARIEREADAKPAVVADPLPGAERWKISDAGKVETFFLAKFGRRLPVAAFGQSELHTRWGLDHRNGMDVPLHPDSQEGRALIQFLRSEGIPFIAFRGPVPRVSTGPHIHVGNRSPRISGR